MKNDYKVHGEVTSIYVKRRNGDIVEAIVDTDDFNKISSISGHWHTYWSSSTKSFYIVRNARKANGKWTIIALHRVITDAPHGVQVDHINNNTLDNRRSNLRFCTAAENQQNLKGAKANSKSGVRGVCWSKKHQKWVSTIKVNGKTNFIGIFSDIDSAALAVKKARSTLMPYSKEASAIAIR